MNALAFRSAAVFLIVAFLSSCHGPDPTVVDHQLRPPESPGEPYVMVVTVKNRGSGTGQVEVVARLIDRASGQGVAEGNKQVDLKPHETLQLSIELRPATQGPFDEKVEVSYPP